MQVRCRCITDIGTAALFFFNKMRSAQAPCGAWAIMKKFIYVCNVKTLHVLSFAIVKVYMLYMNKL